MRPPPTLALSSLPSLHPCCHAPLHMLPYTCTMCITGSPPRSKGWIHTSADDGWVRGDQLASRCHDMRVSAVEGGPMRAAMCLTLLKIVRTVEYQAPPPDPIVMPSSMSNRLCPGAWYVPIFHTFHTSTLQVSTAVRWSLASSGRSGGGSACESADCAHGC